MTTKLKIKDSLYVLKDSKDNYSFISTSTRRIKTFQVDSLVKDVIEFLESEKLESELRETLYEKYSAQNVDLCLKALQKEGIIRRYESDFKEDRHSKQLLFLDELTESQNETLNLQRKIENSKIAVFGV
jgi:hypothetical protein